MVRGPVGPKGDTMSPRRILSARERRAAETVAAYDGKDTILLLETRYVARAVRKMLTLVDQAERRR